MCRSIRPLFNYEPPATDDEIRAAALQFVRKIAGTRTPSKTNTDAFEKAVEEIFETSKRLLEELVPNAPPKDREVEAARAKERSRRRFGKA